MAIIGNETSLKQVIQGMQSESIELLQGTVIQVDPTLKIQVANDDKLILNERVLVVPWHLTDYKTRATFTVPDVGTLDSETTVADDHSHKLSTFTLTKGTITVHNSLILGDVVHLIALNNGKKYYVLDRVEGSYALQ